MLTPSQHTRLQHQHKTLQEILAGVSVETIVYAPQPGKWSAHDQVAHIARYQEVFANRVAAILEKENPSFDRYVPEEDPEFAKWQALSTETLLETLTEHRRHIFSLVTKLHAEQLTRTAVHPKFGKMPLTAWIEFFLLHEAHHIFAVFQCVHT